MSIYNKLSAYFISLFNRADPTADEAFGIFRKVLKAADKTLVRINTAEEVSIRYVGRSRRKANEKIEKAEKLRQIAAMQADTAEHNHFEHVNKQVDKQKRLDAERDRIIRLQQTVNNLIQ